MDELKDIIETYYPEMPPHDCTLSEEDSCAVCEAYHTFAEDIERDIRVDNEKWDTYNSVQGIT